MTSDTGFLCQVSLRGNHRRVTWTNSCQATKEGRNRAWQATSGRKKAWSHEMCPSLSPNKLGKSRLNLYSLDVPIPGTYTLSP